ncbi:MAG: acyl-CoA dehydrogenase family protein [Myxococcales bacterium]|nr:acyl-CoA dehydrogenase family protein [Myxococcales bacterium]
MKPKSSVDDLGVFFEPWHRDVARRAAEVAAAWTPALDADEREATRAAAKALAAAGLLAYCVPEAFGGAAVGRAEQLDARALTLIREALGQADGLLDTAFAMQGLGTYAITLAGSDAQKARYLPGTMQGERLGAFCLTEPEAGSDVASMRCHARRVADGYVIDGEKVFISNAGVAGQYVLFATVDPSLGRRGITAFVVEPDDAGLAIEPIEVIAPHPIGRLRFDGCVIPAERRLGAEGEGFALAMATLDVFRTTVGGAALGMARRALDEAIDRALARRQFGRPIFDQQQVAAYLADSATELDAARLLVFRAAWLRDTRAGRVSAEVAMGKLFATEAAQRIIDRAVQIHGGLGVTRGSVPERLYREVRALRIYEGTSEIQRVVIAAGLRAGRS